MNDDDLALLRSAAAAAGYVVDEDCYRLDERENSGATKKWDPLTDDGDAFRLAVKLKIYCFTRDDASAHAQAYILDDGIGYTVKVYETIRDGDVLSSTRRAIVLAAAGVPPQSPSRVAP